MQNIVITRFSAIARSVMISADSSAEYVVELIGFSAIARSVMISADIQTSLFKEFLKFQCYSS